MPKILLIEDDLTIATSLISGLEIYGLNVVHFADAKHGEMALSQKNHNFDAVLLDLTLPRGDGMDILASWRRKNIDTPVLIITARDAIANRVAGLNAGADDYLVKPFALDELLARLHALIRRSQGRSYSEIRYGDLVYQPDTRQVSFKGVSTELSVKELIILEHILTHPKQIHSRASLEDKVYGWDQDIESNAIEVHIHRLRKKFGTDFILTKRGIGYLINPSYQKEI